ncbi:helix-turn-helix domain-containing protein [Natrarchaeobius oligotrophus]|uniref:Bacterio-opsin activator n=1 Tax=Natrarchaeobius chitinivorans TaxID=1679083 RepID=A0A3N6M479_NATCH|nr:helix-turn-helix domain-containing protein [Natrarchaeobius chitinivorans]RQG96787.1 bacterio-opsin activator [Natrarchaeobius chitinivorans]
MTLIAEFELETPILRAAAEAIEKLRIDEVYETRAGDAKLLVCAFGDAFARFESALEADPTVDAFDALEETADRRPYSVVLTDRAARRLTYPVAVEHDVSFLELMITDTTNVRARVPSREALAAYRRRCRQKDVGFRLRRLYHPQESGAARYGLTDRQREALRVALEQGYFDVPRTTTLASLASELDVSDQALSARLRRGQASLLEHTLADDAPY